MEISKEKLIDIVIKNSDIKNTDSLEMSTRLDELGVDSIGFFTLMFALEEHCGIEISEESIQDLTSKNTINDLVYVMDGLGIKVA